MTAADDERRGVSKSIADGLKGHPSELLAFGVIFLGCGLIAARVDTLIAVGFPGTIYLLYCFKSLLDNGHKRRIAEIEVQKIEAERGKAIQFKIDRALERRRAK